jgi:hypothetical protein
MRRDRFCRATFFILSRRADAVDLADALREEYV